MLAVLRELRQVPSYNQKSLTEQRKPCIYHASIGHLHSQSHYGDLLSNLGFLQASLFWKLASKWKAKAFLGNADNPVKPITLLKPTLLKRGVSRWPEIRGSPASRTIHGRAGSVDCRWHSVLPCVCLSVPACRDGSLKGSGPPVLRPSPWKVTAKELVSLPGCRLLPRSWRSLKCGPGAAGWHRAGRRLMS